MIDPAQPDRAYVLAENTNEAVRIVMREGTVYKYLRPHESFRELSAVARIRQLRLRAVESRLWHELNTLTFDEDNNCIISPYVKGRSQISIATGRRVFLEE
ncbi:MAG: hypothetical protein WD176_05535, partial [Pirellulales bacterium]